MIINSRIHLMTFLFLFMLNSKTVTSQKIKIQSQNYSLTELRAMKKSNFSDNSVHIVDGNLKNMISFSGDYLTTRSSIDFFNSLLDSLYINQFDALCDIGIYNASRINYFHLSKGTYIFRSLISQFNAFTLEDCRFNTLQLSGGQFSGNLIFQDCSFKGFFLINGCEFENIYFNECFLPDTMTFLSNRFRGDVFITNQFFDKIPTIIVDELFPLMHLRVRSEKINLRFIEKISKAAKIRLLSDFLEVQKSIGTIADIKKTELELNELKIQEGNIQLLFQKYLWNYGYDKALLFKWFFVAFILFYFSNLFLFNVLIKDVYKIENIEKEYKICRQSKNFKKLTSTKYYSLVFLYSALIYFGIKMNIDNFYFKKTFLTLYIFFFYLIGLVLLFYVVSLILANKV